MKKQKWLSVTLVVLLMITFCGCGKELGVLTQHKQTGEHETGGMDVSGDEESPGTLYEKEKTGNDATEDNSEIPTVVPPTQISHKQQEVIDGFVYQIPCEENWYIVEVPGGLEVAYDLNGDGIKEKIYYATGREEKDTRYITSFAIGGKEFKDCFPMAGAREQFFSIVDLVKNDGFFELAIYTQGEEKEEKTYFYRYTGEGLEQVGKVSGFVDMAAIDSGEAHLDGNGNIYSMFSLDLLKDYEASGWWQLTENGRIGKVYEELYCPLAIGKVKVVVKDELKLYMERNLESEYVTVLPSDEKVSFQATDDKEWLLVSVGNKATGWINKQSLAAIGEFAKAGE